MISLRTKPTGAGASSPRTLVAPQLSRRESAGAGASSPRIPVASQSSRSNPSRSAFLRAATATAVLTLCASFFTTHTQAETTPTPAAGLEAALHRAAPEVRATLDRVRAATPATRAIARPAGEAPEADLSASDPRTLSRALSRDLERWSARQVRERSGALPLRLRAADSFEERKALIREFRATNHEWLEAHRTEVDAAARFLREAAGDASPASVDPARSERSERPEPQQTEALEARRDLIERLRDLPPRERAEALRRYRDDAVAERTERAGGAQ